MARGIHTVLGCLALLLSGCGQTDTNTIESSKLLHDTDNPINGTSHFQWHEVSQSDFDQVVQPIQMLFVGFRQIKFLPDDHPLTKRAQYWIDTIHQELVQSFPEKLKNTPAPKAKVRLEKVPNAFVMPIPVCYEVPLILDESVEANDSNTTTFAAVSPDGQIIPAWHRGYCVKKNADLDYFKGYVEWFNNEHTACQLSIKTDSSGFAIIPQAGCQKDSAFSGFAKARSIYLMPTANIITIYSGLVSLLNEEEFSAVIAHELGHYYKAHPSVSPEGRYDFFYKLDEQNPDHRPTPDPSLTELGQQVKSVYLPTRPYRKVEGQQYRSELHIPMRFIASVIDSKQNCEKVDNCNKACKETRTLIESSEFANAMGRFPVWPLNAEGVKAYEKFESLFSSCAQDVKIADDGVDNGTSLSKEDLEFALGVDPNLFPIFAKAEIKDHLVSTLVELTNKVNEAEKVAIVPLQKAKEVRLGYYTIEQEADELSLEWMADVGIEAKFALSTELLLGDFIGNLYQSFGIEPYPTEVDANDCRRLYNNGWKGDDGKPFFVPIADYEDIHHSSCYRAYNLSREVTAHNITVASDAPTHEFDRDLWKKIRDDLASEAANSSSIIPRGIMMSKTDKTALNEAQIFINKVFGGCAFFGN